MNIQPTALLIAACALSLSVDASAMRVRADHDGSVDFSKYRTYAWVAIAETMTRSPTTDSGSR